MHFLAVALVYAAADSSKDSDTLFTGEIKHKTYNWSFSNTETVLLQGNQGACLPSPNREAW